jgi:N-acetyltransferase 10
VFQGVLLGLGLQHKTVEVLEQQLDLPASQLLGLFNKIIRKMVQHFTQIMEEDVEQVMVERQEIELHPVEQTIDEELVCNYKFFFNII